MSFRKFILRPFIKLFNLFLPAVCCFCGNSNFAGLSICSGCHSDLPILPQSCIQCAQFIPENSAGILYCGNCLKSPPPFERVFALFPYEAPIIELIKQFKYGGNLSYGRVLSELMIHKIQTDWYQNRPLPTVIIPVPLHPSRLRERGFNQAVEIARPIAKYFSIPLGTDGLKRIHFTQSQSGLRFQDRQQNIAQAFTATAKYAGLSVVVVDDVMTTGATLRECCKTLSAAGVKSIDIWCCARR